VRWSIDYEEAIEEDRFTDDFDIRRQTLGYLFGLSTTGPPSDGVLVPGSTDIYVAHLPTWPIVRMHYLVRRNIATIVVRSLRVL
jgi:hypothetical protein